MIAIKNADGTLVPVVEGLAGNQRTVALSLVHTNQKRAEIQLYEIEAPDSEEHPPVLPGQKPFGVLVLKRLPENPFGEVEITAAISVDSDLVVHIQAEAEGIRPATGEFRLSGAVLDQTLPVDGPESIAEADPFDFSDFDLDGPGLPAPSTSQNDTMGDFMDEDLPGFDEPGGQGFAAEAAGLQADGDPILAGEDAPAADIAGFDDDFGSEFSEADPLGLDDGNNGAAATPGLDSLDFDNFGFGDDQSKIEDGFAGSLDDQPTLDPAGLDGVDTDEAEIDEVPFELDLGNPDESDAQSFALPAPDSQAFIDDPDDTDWGFDELADPADENLAAPAISLEGEDESLSLGDEADFTNDFGANQDTLPAGEPPAEELAAAKPPKAPRVSKPAKPAGASPVATGLVGRLLRASVALFAVSVIELGVYLALHFGLFP